MVVGSQPEPTPLPDEERFALSFSLGPSDEALFNAEFVRRRDNPWLILPWLVGILSFLGVVWGFFLLLSGGDVAEHFWTAFTLPLVAVAIGIVGVAIAIRLVRRVFAERLLNVGDASVQTYVEGLSLRVGAGERFLPWAEVSELLTTPCGVYLALRDRTVLMLPVRAFDDAEERYVFASIVTKYARV